MGKKTANAANRPKTPAPARKQPATVKDKSSSKRNIILICIAVAATAIVYSTSIGNGWIKNWDDGGYVTEKNSNDILSASLIYHLTGSDIHKIFTTFYKGNYHPLTTLVFALEYRMAGDHAALYHWVNLIFHLLNVMLVFFFVRKVVKRPEIAFIAALFFGIHPMHIESVAWISELKDVMYTFFFLLSLIFYMRQNEAKQGKLRLYLVSLLFFILSCFAKSAAVILPAVLILLDFYTGRKWKNRFANHANSFIAFIGKVVSSSIYIIPFIIVSLVFGMLAVYSQKSAGAIQDLDPLFSWFERPMLASYAALTYLWKLFVPINLACMYPYPDRIAGHLPTMYYIAPVVILLLAGLVVYSWKFTRDIVFGMLFFLFTIMLVLQVLPVGGAIVAERYSYIPYIGLFIIIGKGYVFSQESKARIAALLKWVYPALLVSGVIIFCLLSFQRMAIWKNGEVLFTDLIKKNPSLPFAYNNRGYMYQSFVKDNVKALSDYNKCIALDSTFHRAYSNRGVLYYNFYGPNKSDSLHLQLALKDFTKALKYKSNNTDALIGRANTYSTLQEYAKSIPDYDYYIKLKSDDSKSYLWRAIALYNVGKYDSAFADVSKCMEMDPTTENIYLWRGILYSKKKDYNASIKDFDQLLKQKPDNLDAYNWRGLAKYNLKMYKDAIADYNSALAINPKDPTVYINRSSAWLELKNYKQAFKDYCSAGDLRYALDKAHFFKLKGLAGE